MLSMFIPPPLRAGPAAACSGAAVLRHRMQRTITDIKEKIISKNKKLHTQTTGTAAEPPAAASRKQVASKHVKIRARLQKHKVRVERPAAPLQCGFVRRCPSSSSPQPRPSIRLAGARTLQLHAALHCRHAAPLIGHCTTHDLLPPSPLQPFRGDASIATRDAGKHENEGRCQARHCRGQARGCRAVRIVLRPHDGSIPESLCPLLPSVGCFSVRRRSCSGRAERVRAVHPGRQPKPSRRDCGM